MYTLSVNDIFSIFEQGFKLGNKRSTTLSNKILREWFEDEIVKPRLERRDQTIKETV